VCNARASRPAWLFFATLAGIAFILNLPWEIVQMSAYEPPAPAGASTALAHVVPSLGDAALTIAMYGLCALAAGRWRLAGTWNEYVAAALLSGACAVAYEWKALASGWWSYSSRMPVVPLLGVGLWGKAVRQSSGRFSDSVAGVNRLWERSTRPGKLCGVGPRVCQIGTRPALPGGCRC
jgi:hypothetical protein